MSKQSKFSMVVVLFAFVMLVLSSLACGSCEGDSCTPQGGGNDWSPSYGGDVDKTVASVVAPVSTAVHNINKAVEDKVAPKVVAPVQQMVATVASNPDANNLKQVGTGDTTHYDVGCDCYTK